MPPVNHNSPDTASVLGPTLRFKGDLLADEDLHIHGHIEGSITHSKYLTVCREGHVKADIKGHIVAVQGTVEGNITAETSVAVSNTGHLMGDIRAPSISVNDGADFNGKVFMEAAKPAPVKGPTVSNIPAPRITGDAAGAPKEG